MSSIYMLISLISRISQESGQKTLRKTQMSWPNVEYIKNTIAYINTTLQFFYFGYHCVSSICVKSFYSDSSLPILSPTMSTIKKPFLLNVSSERCVGTIHTYLVQQNTDR